MPELSAQSAFEQSQFDPKMAAREFTPDHPDAFGSFYDWKTGNQMNPSALLTRTPVFSYPANKPKNSD